jgi:hypothetical protein
VQLPFTPDEFFGVFADYNQAVGMVVVVLWLVSALVVAIAWRHPVRHSRALTLFLAALWAWNAAAYHALLFARINPAAWLFAGLFLVQGVLLFCAGVARDVEYFAASRVMNGVGVSLVGYAFLYPLPNLTLGHPYPGTPTFGVPCPTAILTIGALLTVRRVRPTLAVIPVLWALVGGSAAILLGVWPDYVPLAAGILLMRALIGRRKT